MKLFAIFGDPVSHSRSPLMHNCLFKNLNYKACYTRVHLKDGSKLKETFFSLGLSGANVTVPHKEEAYKACDEVRGFAKTVGVVNTLINENGKLIGYNTDADGFMYAIEEFGAIKNILILGAGGTAKALASRFVVDLNRERTDFSEGQGVIITESWTGEKVLKKELSESEVEGRLKEFYDPFYEKLDSFLNTSKKPLLVIDGHSMDSKGSAVAGDTRKERPEICLATGDGTASEEIIALFENDLKSAGGSGLGNCGIGRNLKRNEGRIDHIGLRGNFGK